MVVDANKDIKDMTELFHVISSNINTKDDEKENAPVESLDNHKSKRPIDKNIVQAPSKRPSILRDSSFWLSNIVIYWQAMRLIICGI